MTARLGRADLHIHTLASDGTSGVSEILDHVERDTELDVIAITDNERIDAEVRPLSELDAILAETTDSKTLIGLYRLRDRLNQR